MTDPLDVLRTPPATADPDPDFAARLRARIARTLNLPEGVDVTATNLDQPLDTAPAITAAVTPYLAVSNARAAIDWYIRVLSARPVGDPIVMPDGSVGHAELDLAGARVFLADEHPEIGVSAPQPGSGAAVSLHLEVGDVDAVTARAGAAHAVVERVPSDNPYGRIGVIRDPFGHRWMLNSPPPAVELARPGDVGFFSLWVEDVERAAAFYATVLGWSYSADHGPDRVLVGTSFPHRVTALADARKVFGPDQHPTLFCSRGVENLDAAAERVRAAGGQVRERAHEHGRVLDCLDDQAVPFSMHQNGPDTPRPATNGARSGDVAYLTMQVADAGRARRFYSAVFGWTFSSGRVEDGWQTHDPAPMTGLHGGHPRVTLEPMYRVDDLGAAVQRVRAAGGAATEPEHQPYGLSASCTDDQGMAFLLGQF